MTNIEIARLATAILVSGLVCYAIGYIMAYIFTWNDAKERFAYYKSIIEDYKASIKIWDEAYGKLADKYIDTLLEKALK